MNKSDTVRKACRGPASAWRGIRSSACWIAALAVVPLAVFFSGQSVTWAGFEGFWARHGRACLAVLLAVSIIAVLDSFRAIVAGYRQGAGFPLGPSLLFAAGALDAIMACRWLLVFPVFP